MSASGAVSDAAGVEQFLRAYIQGTVGHADAAATVIAMRSAEANDLRACVELDATLEAIKSPPKCARPAARWDGRSLRIATTLIDARADRTVRAAGRSRRDAMSSCGGFRYRGRGLRMAVPSMRRRLILYSTAAAIVGAALRLIPLGQTQGQANSSIARAADIDVWPKTPDIEYRRHDKFRAGIGNCRDAPCAPGSEAVPIMIPKPLKIGIGGPVGSGKTALVESLCRRMHGPLQLAVITNDIYTREDAEFLTRRQALAADRILGVETGGCPHTAIREDASVNLEAVRQLTSRFSDLDLLIIESGGDNLAATFSPELVDATIYVIDVAEGDKIPRKGGPGIIRSGLLVINKIDLAPYVGADLGVMERDARRARGERPFVFTNLKTGAGAEQIVSWIKQELLFAA